ncbi:MAG: hypothetical protein EA370_02740 [Wenzhouxiangella sp.]|nr:MAG: hypothetical protein EA370_02740 [Wenzhouxiangella sp.]
MLKLTMGLVAVALSGLLINAAADGVASVPQPLMAWIAFAPWLAASTVLRPKAAFALGLLMGLAYFVPGRWAGVGPPLLAISDPVWTGHLWTLGLSLTYALPFAVFGWIDSKWLRRSLPAALEPLARAAILATLGGVLWTPFPLTPAILIVDHTPMIQLAEFGGETLAFWLMLLPSATLAQLFVADDWTGFGKSLAVGLVLLSAAALFGEQRVRQVDAAAARHEPVSVMALQLSLTPNTMAGSLTALRTGGRTSAAELTRNALADDPSCLLAVWPELPIQPERIDFVCRRAPYLAARLQTPLLMHCNQSDERRSGAAWLFRPDEPVPKKHHKSALVPLYETDLWRGLLRLEEGTPGTVMHLNPDVRVIPSICYESHSHRHIRAGSAAGGNLIAQLSNFTVFGGAVVDRVDLATTRMLAVEYRLPVVRSVNGETAGWIDAVGRLRELTTDHSAAGGCAEVQLPNLDPTLFAKAGPWVAWLPGLFAIGLAWGWRRRSAFSQP